MTYRLLRSARKTFAMEMGPDGLIVRVPYRATAKQIEKFIRDHEAWIQAREAKLSRAMKAQKGPEKLTTEDIRSLAEKARQVIPEQSVRHLPQRYSQIPVKSVTWKCPRY